MTWQEKNQQTIKKTLAIIKIIPFIRMIVLTGSMAEGRASEQSDIDLFIQVEEGKLWSTRFFVTLVLQLLGLRRTDTDIAGKVCLNWFATFNAPAIQKGRVYKILWSQDGQIRNPKSVIEQLILIFLIWWLEPLLKMYQIQRILRDKRTHAPGSQVRYSDSELGFHSSK